MVSFSRAGGLVALLALLPLSMRLSMQAVRHFDPGYNDEACNLQMVKDTNAEHYMIHPLWSKIVPETTCNTGEYLKKQAEGTAEAVLVTLFTVLTRVVAFVVVAWAGLRKDLPSLVAICLVAERMSSELQCFTHICNDITQMNGTILHHVPAWDGVGSSGVKVQVAEGMFATVFISFIFFLVAMHLVFQGSRYSPKHAMALFFPVHAANVRFHMGLHVKVHDLGHAAASSSSWPWEMWYFKCHVQGHHVDGMFCSSASAAQLVYDPILLSLGSLVDGGYLQHGSKTWMAICFGMEIVVFAQAIFKMYLLVKILAFLHGWAERRFSARVPEKKAL
jgi:hypothetical protein